MLTIALGQMRVHRGQPQANLARAREFAAQARDANADLLLLPELWLHGYDLERAQQWGASLGEGGFAEMAELARGFDLYVAGSLLESHAGGVSNTAVVYKPDGTLLGSYRKLHLFRHMLEDRYLTPGDHAVLCSTDWGSTGLAICYDLRFPELFRTMALAGARVFLIPAQWPAARLEAWRLMVRARATENELIVVACNRVGSDDTVKFPGHSLVVDPWGNVVEEGDDQECLLIARVDLGEIGKAREYLTVFQDRRPDAYRVELPTTDQSVTEGT
jgi:predicted amidohydrolase